ncbi:MAG: DUF4403 family protein [Bacteroidota bacterium]
MSKSWSLLFRVSLFCLLFITSCKLRSELPEIVAEEIKIPSIESSTIQIPVEIDIEPIISYANAKTVKTIRNPEYPAFSSFEGVEGPRANYDVLIGNLSGNMSGNAFNISTTAAYGIAGDYCSEIVWGKCIHPRIPFSCGTGSEAKRKVKISFSTKLDITSNYGLKTQTVVSEVKPLDPCEMTFLKIDMTNKVMEAMRPSLNDCAKLIDEQSKSTSFKSIAQAAWNELWTPIEIEGYGFLNIQPKAINVSPLTGTGRLLKFNIGLTATPNFTLSKDTLIKTPSLPKLQNSIANQSLFVFNLPILSNYNELSNTLSKNLKEKTFLSDDGKQSILIHEISINGKGNSTVLLTMNCDLKTGIKKFKNATLYFTMKPVYDNKTQVLEFRDVKLASDKKHILLQAGTELFQKTIAQKIQAFSKTDLKPILDSNKKIISQQLHKQRDNNAILNGQVNAFTITGIYPTEANLIIHTQAIGQLSLKMSNYKIE